MPCLTCKSKRRIHHLIALLVHVCGANLVVFIMFAIVVLKETIVETKNGTVKYFNLQYEIACNL